MGDANSLLSAAEARHLVRRTGFGVDRNLVDALAGLTRGQAAARLLDFKVRANAPRGRDFRALHDKWLKQLVGTRVPLFEKLVLFWHDHFATNFTTVPRADAMSRQNRRLREFCKGNFREFVRAMNTDWAMMIFLDTEDNQKEVPNENYARELLELFTLGVFDANGNANYAEADIKQIARAFTGWSPDDRGLPQFTGGSGDTAGGADCGWYSATGEHDYSVCFPERGPKVIFQSTGGFGPGGRSFTVGGEGANEIDEVVDILFAHTDSDGRNTVARYIGRRLFEHFAYANPATAVIDAIIDDSGFDTSFVIADYLASLFCHDEFFASMAPPGPGVRRSVKWPIDYVLGTLRMLKVKPQGRRLYIAGGDWSELLWQLERMGQVLFEPPTVFGWDLEGGWVSSSSLLARYSFARDVTAAREGSGRFQHQKVVDLDLTDPAAIVDAVLEALGVPDQFSPAEIQVMRDYLGPGPVDLWDYDTRNRKLSGLFRLVLQSPAYQTH
jgi:uncharacterized protein (DUF1800 family)